MAGMTDTAFRRLVKRHGGCGLVVTEMVSCGRARPRHRSHARVRRIHRGRAADFDPDLRRRSRQDGRRRADRRGHGRRHRRRQHGLPRAEDREAQRRLQPDARARRTPPTVIAAMAKAVKIPVTVKMRAGWSDAERNAPTSRGWWRMRAPPRSPCTAAPRRRATAGPPTGISSRASPTACPIPVFGSGDCIEPRADRRPAAARASTACSSAAACCATRGFLRRPQISPRAASTASGHARRSRQVSPRVHRPARCTNACAKPTASGIRRRAATPPRIEASAHSRGHDRWVINKLRALGSWYTKGLDNGSHLRTAINHAESLDQLRDVISLFFSQAASSAA